MFRDFWRKREQLFAGYLALVERTVDDGVGRADDPEHTTRIMFGAVESVATWLDRSEDDPHEVAARSPIFDRRPRRLPSPGAGADDRGSTAGRCGGLTYSRIARAGPCAQGHAVDLPIGQQRQLSQHLEVARHLVGRQLHPAVRQQLGLARLAPPVVMTYATPAAW